MSKRVAVLFVALAWVIGSAAGAAAGEVVKSGVGFEASGKVVARSADQLVIRTDDHGHKIAFAVDRSTVLPDDLAIGRHVRVVYHPLGSTGQAADKVQVTTPQSASR